MINVTGSLGGMPFNICGIADHTLKEAVIVSNGKCPCVGSKSKAPRNSFGSLVSITDSICFQLD